MTDRKTARPAGQSEPLSEPLSERELDVLRLLGKNGEAEADRPISLTFKHRLFTQSVDAQVQTDADGRVELGALEDITWIRASEPAGS